MAKSKVVKRAYNLLGECKDPRLRSAILNGAADQLINTICNAGLSVERGDIALNKSQKKAFKKHRNAVTKLTSRSYSLGQKSSFMKQKGDAFDIIPIPLSTALTALWSTSGATISHHSDQTMKKMTLVEQGVLDTLRQNQITQEIQQREISAMVKIRTQNEETLNNSKLTDTKKLDILNVTKRNMASSRSPCATRR